MKSYLLANWEHIGGVYQPLKTIRGSHFHFIVNALKDQVGDNTLKCAFFRLYVMVGEPSFKLIFFIPFVDSKDLSQSWPRF